MGAAAAAAPGLGNETGPQARFQCTYIYFICKANLVWIWIRLDPDHLAQWIGSRIHEGDNSHTLKILFLFFMFC
jgi:hypothetical protein